MYGIEHHFVPTVSVFMALFVIYVVTVAVLWFFGVQKREELIKKIITDKARE